MLNDLIKILPPPTSPNENDNIDWQAIEQEIGVGLPDDYKELINIYGGGIIGDFLVLMNPNSINQNLNIDAMCGFHKSYAYMKDEFPDGFPRPNFPENGSFLAWARTLNADSLMWIIDGEPNNWKVGIHGRDQEEEEELTSFDTTEFMLKLVRGEIDSEIIPDDFAPKGFEILP